MFGRMPSGQQKNIDKLPAENKSYDTGLQTRLACESARAYLNIEHAIANSDAAFMVKPVDHYGLQVQKIYDAFEKDQIQQACKLAVDLSEFTMTYTDKGLRALGG